LLCRYGGAVKSFVGRRVWIFILAIGRRACLSDALMHVGWLEVAGRQGIFGLEVASETFVFGLEVALK
jgi:hypothetical protein